MTVEAPEVQTYQSMRPYLFTVAYRMTGSASDAEDLVQDAWVRYLDAGSPAVGSLRAYLTTIVSRLALDYLKSARTQREQYIGTWLPEPVLTGEAVPGPAETVEQREAVSIAFLTLLERLTPEQRVVYVLRQAFDVSYEEIAGLLDKSTAACRQILHRAELRLSKEHRRAVAPADDLQQRIERFLAAFTAGNVTGVAELLAPDVVWVSDGGPRRLAIRHAIHGSDKVARGLAGFARKQLAMDGIEHELIDVNGSPAIVSRRHGDIEQVTVLDVLDRGISGVRSIRNPDKLRHLAASLGSDVARIEDRLKPLG